MAFLNGTDPGLRQTRTPTVDTFAAGVGFTAGSSTYVTLSVDCGTEASLITTFDGITQHRDTYSYDTSNRRVTFDAAIPTGVSKIECTYTTTIPATTPADGSVTEAKLGGASVTQAKLGDEAVNEAKLQVSNAPTNGQFLSAQSGDTGGLTWAAAGLTNYGFLAQRTSGQTLSASTWTKIQFNTETYDPQSDYDNSSNYRYTPTSAGYYLCALTVATPSANGNAQIQGAIYRNGSSFLTSSFTYSGGGGFGKTQTTVGPIFLNGSSDYIEGYGWHNGDGNDDFDDMLFSAWKVGVA